MGHRHKMDLNVSKHEVWRGVVHSSACAWWGVQGAGCARDVLCACMWMRCMQSKKRAKRSVCVPDRAQICTHAWGCSPAPLCSAQTGGREETGTHTHTGLWGGTRGRGVLGTATRTNPGSYSGAHRPLRRAPSRWGLGFCTPAGRDLSYQCLSQTTNLHPRRGRERKREGVSWGMRRGRLEPGRGDLGVPTPRRAPPCPYRSSCWRAQG